jgi:hypothetical protein
VLTGLPSFVGAETVDSAGTAATAVGMWTCDKIIFLSMARHFARAFTLGFHVLLMKIREDVPSFRCS